ncbi:hypothetical protein FKM82_023100 [Ascaphus truei]
MAIPQVAHSEHQTQLAVPLRYHRVMAEHQSLRSLLGLGHLNKHAAYEESIHDRSQQRLKQEEDDAFRAFLRDIPKTIANSSFGLYEEEESGWEVVHIGHARSVVIIVGSVDVPSDVGNDPPHRSHDQPGHGVRHDEDQQVPPPLQVHQRGEEVREVSARLPPQVPVLHVAAPVLVHEPLPFPFDRREEPASH